MSLFPYRLKESFSAIRHTQVKFTGTTEVFTHSRRGEKWRAEKGMKREGNGDERVNKRALVSMSPLFRIKGTY